MSSYFKQWRVILQYPPLFSGGTVPTQILAIRFKIFNPDHLFKLLGKLVTGRIGSV